METNDLDSFKEITLESDSEYEYSYHTESSTDAGDEYEIELDEERSIVERAALDPVDFEQYIRDHCDNKVKVLNRSTFNEIKKPIIMIFNHFNEKCAYHTKCLDKLYHLSLKYNERIEFIAADLFDIDVVKYKRIAVDFFYEMHPADADTFIYAIDEQKRIHEVNYTEDHSLEGLTLLCENLLRGSLFISQPLSESSTSSLVKVCVHDNYNELVTNSTKLVLLITNHCNYSELKTEDITTYETVAKELANDNVDVIYLNGSKNYIPYELGIVCYTTLVLIPHDDKSNFLCHPIIGADTAENIISTIKIFLKDRNEYFELKHKEENGVWYYPLNIKPDFNIDLQELPQYLQDNCFQHVKLLEREFIETSQDNNLIAFMDFKEGKCTTQHLKCIDEIYQVAINLTERGKYFIADFKDIDVINSEWTSEDFIEITESEKIKPKIYGIDRNKNKFLLRHFKNVASLYYFAYYLAEGELGEEDMIKC